MRHFNNGRILVPVIVASAKPEPIRHELKNVKSGPLDRAGPATVCEASELRIDAGIPEYTCVVPLLVLPGYY
eukprot:489845-Rhodomonas_salina.2